MSAFFIGISSAFLALGILTIWANYDDVKKHGKNCPEYEQGVTGMIILIISSMVLIASVIARLLS